MKKAKKEQDILSEAEKERKFYVDYSNAFCSKEIIIKGNIEGIWKTNRGDLKLKFDEKINSFSISEITRKEQRSARGLLLSPPRILSPQPKTYYDEHLNIIGTFENMSGKYSLKIEKKEEKQQTLLTGSTSFEATGYMVINENYDRIEIMEKTNSKIEYLQWTKQQAKEETDTTKK